MLQNTLILGLTLGTIASPLLATERAIPDTTVTEDRRVVNVRELGAKGDGEADDSAAFQKAIDSVSQSGGVVYIPAGNYRIARTLLVGGSHPRAGKVLDYIELVGEGKNAARLLADGIDFVIAAKHVTSEKTGERTIIHGLTARNLTFAPLRPGRENQCSGIDATYMIRWTVRSCHFIGLKTGIYSLEQTKMGDMSPDVLAVYIIRIHDNLFYGCTDYAIKLGRIFDVSIENNEIEHGVGGIRIGLPGDKFDAAANNIRIVNNIIEGLGGIEPAIGGSCWIGSRIVGNYFEGNQGGDIELTPKKGDGWSRGLVIASNTFQPTKAQRAGSYGPIYLTQTLDTVIMGNFTTGEHLLHPSSDKLSRGVNLISNTLNNPPEIGDIRGAKAGNPADYTGKLTEESQKQAERWTVSGPAGTVGIHSLFGLQFQPGSERTRSIAYATGAPEGKVRRYQSGDWLLNMNPLPDKGGRLVLGWVCVESGAPGRWRAVKADTDEIPMVD